MTTPVHTIAATADASLAWNQMQLHRVRHLVVAGPDGRAIGVVAASDLGGKRGDAMRVGRQVHDLMTERLVTATPDTTIREAANLMRGHAVNCLPVFEGTKLRGIVTALDLLELLGKGAERPVQLHERRVLKDRGVKPRPLAVAKRTSRTPTAGNQRSR
jgi:CBS domain-containing protein